MQPFLVSVSPPSELEYHQHVINRFDLDRLRQPLGC